MEVKKLYICEKVEDVVEVTKEELEKINNLCDYVLIEKDAIEYLVHSKPNDIVGVLRYNLVNLLLDIESLKKEKIHRNQYVKFIPKPIVDRYYKELDSEFTFSETLNLIKDGYKLTNKENDSFEYIYLDENDKIELKTGNYSYKKISCKLSNGEVVEYKTNFDDYFSKQWIIVKD